MGGSDHLLVNGDEHEVLLQDDAVELGVVEGEDALGLPTVVFFVELEGLVLGVQDLGGEKARESF